MKEPAMNRGSIIKITKEFVWLRVQGAELSSTLSLLLLSSSPPSLPIVKYTICLKDKYKYHESLSMCVYTVHIYITVTPFSQTRKKTRLNHRVHAC